MTKQVKSDITKKLISAAEILPESAIEQLCMALDVLPDSANLESMLSVCAPIGNPGQRMKVQELINAWVAQVPPCTPSSLAWGLRATTGMNNHWREKQSVELVWTGPSTEHSTLRRTDQALLDVIQAAKSELIIVTFVAYKVNIISDALASAVERGVTIHFILESKDAKTAPSALSHFGSISNNSEERLLLYEWPTHVRGRDDSGNHGIIHAKCAVADEEIAFVSSANLTGHAMSLNMELGLLLRGGDMPSKISLHFQELIAKKILVRISVD